MDKLKVLFEKYEKEHKALYENINFVDLFAFEEDSKIIKSKILESVNNPLSFYKLLQEANLGSYYNKVAHYMGWENEFNLLTEGEYPVGDIYADLGYIPNLYDSEPQEEEGEEEGEFKGFPLYWIFTDKDNNTIFVQFDDQADFIENNNKYPENREGFHTQEEAQEEYRRRGGSN